MHEIRPVFSKIYYGRRDKSGKGLKQEVKVQNFEEFVSDAFVSVSEFPESYIQIKALRDTGSNQSLIVQSCIPELECKMESGGYIQIQGIENTTKTVPLIEINLISNLVRNRVTVGVIDKLPVPGVSLLVGNDLAGSKVSCVKNSTDVGLRATDTTLRSKTCCNSPDICSNTRHEKFHKINDDYDSFDEESFNLNLEFVNKKYREERYSDHNDTLSGIVDRNLVDVKTLDTSEYPFCEHINYSFCHDNGDKFIGFDTNDCTLVTTRAMSRKEELEENNDFSKKMFDNLELNVNMDNFSNDQKADFSLRYCYKALVDIKNISCYKKCFYLKDGILMRKKKYLPPNVCIDDEHFEMHQILVPFIYRDRILQVSHDYSHCGISKTLKYIQKSFTWPDIKKDVKNYVKSCDSCQKILKVPIPKMT